MNSLSTLGNVPFRLSVLEAIFPDCKHLSDKAKRLESAGEIVRLKKDLYVVSEDVSGKALSRELIANHLYGPSYVSRSTALRYWGLIPERVMLMQSVTTKHNREFSNPTGNYHFQNCSVDYFHWGIKMEELNGICFLIASPEKALCDYVAFMPGLNLRFMTEVATWLEEDLRFDMDVLPTLNIELMENIAKYSRKQQSINAIIKYLKHERNL